MIIADGGSRDRTVALARAHALAPTVVAAVPGRGTQLNAGARIASGGALVFLHADTRLPPGALDLVRRACADGAPGATSTWHGMAAGCSRGCCGSSHARKRRLGVFYGDTVIWVRRDVFRALGGYPPIPLMEDYVLRAASRAHPGGPAAARARS